MSNKRLIAVCDILGFKKLVNNQNLDKLINEDLSLFRRLVAYSVNHGGVPELPPQLKTIREQDRVGFAWFSDTLLIYAKDDEDISCRNVLETVGWLLFSTMQTHTRLRCGISYGELYAEPENELFIGLAIVEAYELEKAQEWAGAALSESAARRIPERKTNGQRYQWWVCNYTVPLKPPKQGLNVNCSNLAIDWTQGIHKKPFDLKWSPSHDEPTLAERQKDESTCCKWENTCRFHREVCITCFSENKARDSLKVI